jgi:purine-binding chemotaxis protein CheW
VPGVRDAGEGAVLRGAVPHGREQTSEVLQFTVAGEHRAIALAWVVEIIRPRAVTRVPFAPAGLLGVINLRGTVLPVICLGTLHGGAASAGRSKAVSQVTSGARIIVAHGAGNQADLIGLLVDSVASPSRDAGDEASLLDLPALMAQIAVTSGKPKAGPAATQAGEPHAAPATIAAPPKGQTQSLVELICFTVGAQDYGWPLDQVAEIIAAPRSVAALPEQHAAIVGAADWRGTVLPLVSLRTLLGLPAAALPAGSRACRVVVTRIGSAMIGLVVDAMKPILLVPETSIDPVPPALTRGTGETRIDALCRLDGGRALLCILSPARLFDAATTARLQAGAASTGLQRGAALDGGRYAAPAAETETCAVFRLGDETYGLPVAAVAEVARRPQHVASLPGAPDFIDGVMNLRGGIIPIVNLARRFGVAAAAPEGGRVMIVTLDGAGRDSARVGFAVDGVAGAVAIPRAAIVPAPPAVSGLFHRVATPDPAGPMILLIDPAALLAAGIAAP